MVEESEDMVALDPDFLAKLEEEATGRYTEDDTLFMQHRNKEAPQPPVLPAERSDRGRHRGGFRHQNYRGGGYQDHRQGSHRDYNAGSSNYGHRSYNAERRDYGSSHRDHNADRTDYGRRDQQTGGRHNEYYGRRDNDSGGQHSRPSY